MDLLLIRPPDPMQHVQLLAHTRPMNLAYLAAYLRNHNIKVGIIDYEIKAYSDEVFLKILKEETPSIIGVSCMTPTIRNGAKICALAKSYSREIITVVGGPHANGLPIHTIKEYPSFDYLVYGEGEVTLLELCNSIRNDGNKDSINGLVFRKGEEIIQNSTRKLIEDLDSIPFPARDLIDYGTQAGHTSRGFSNKILSTELFTSRGCPIGCTFCAIQKTFGNTVRFRETSFVEEEIKQLIKDYHFNHIVVADDTFTLKKDRAFELCEIFKRNGIKSWSCDTRANTVSRELLCAMENSGCRKVAFGVESGSQRIIDLTGKKIKIEQVERAVHWAREAGIEHIEGNFILGADPSETIKDIEMTRKLMHSLPWTFVTISIIVPYPGTRTYNIMKKKGMLHDDVDWEDFVVFGKPPKWHTEHFSSKDLITLQKKLTREFYLTPKYIIKQLMSIRSWLDLRYWFVAGFSYLKWFLSR